MPIENGFLESERIYLRPLEEGDVDGNYLKWLNDPDVTKYNSHGRFPMTRSKLLKYVNACNENNNQIILAIVSKETGEHIGNIGLQNINWIDRNVEIGFLLGEKEYWGKGIMYEAGRLLIDHGFTALNLHRIYCGTSSDNLGMQKLAEKLGMREEGRRKEAIIKNGKPCDIIEYGILRDA